MYFACIGYHADFNGIVHMMDTADNRERINRSCDRRADAEGNGDNPLNADENPLFELCEHGSENGQCEIAGYKNGHQRGDKEVDHFGHDFVQPFF